MNPWRFHANHLIFKTLPQFPIFSDSGGNFEIERNLIFWLMELIKKKTSAISGQEPEWWCNFIYNLQNCSHILLCLYYVYKHNILWRRRKKLHIFLYFFIMFISTKFCENFRDIQIWLGFPKCRPPWLYSACSTNSVIPNEQFVSF